MNAGSAALIGTYLPDILNAVPPKYQSYVSAAIAVVGMLSGLFQKHPKND